ncbi:unnamed protein product [Adineta steineri]|uniref:Uncharacterized protein n=1 Tax=Adineta steineri TaxID=433720 RepID=A0A818WWP3_9BILA|nr:unnamed protein product [Adineta steineri]CAF3749140.1 unnamed protein product [Adineta steineri]
MWVRKLGFQTSPSVRILTQACEYMFKNGIPDTFHFSLLPDNWDDFYWILSNTIKRIPILAESECETLITGADSFTPNSRLIMNESAEVSYSVASGSNGHGIVLAGGPYVEVLGCEYPLFFKPDEAGKKDFQDLNKQGTFGKARWFNIVKKEYNAYDIIYKPIGTVVHTGMLNEQGDFRPLISFLLVSPTSQSTRNMKWLKTHVPEDTSIFLSDVTSLYTGLNIIGPKAKYLLSELNDENFNDFARMT